MPTTKDTKGTKGKKFVSLVFLPLCFWLGRVSGCVELLLWALFYLEMGGNSSADVCLNRVQ